MLLDGGIVVVIEVVQNDDLAAPRDKALDDMRADESGAPCDQDGHGSLLLTIAMTEWCNVLRAADDHAMWGAAAQRRGEHQQAPTRIALVPRRVESSSAGK